LLDREVRPGCFQELADFAAGCVDIGRRDVWLESEGKKIRLG
jgi:hypothetical protein